MHFRSVTGEALLGGRVPGCPRCGEPMLYREFSDGTSETVCSANRNHDGEVCRKVGHPDAWSQTERCDLCAAPAQWVRVEVGEGKAYTYVAFEDPLLGRGERVIVPGNVVHRDPFVGTVLRLLAEPDATYPGPYKAILRRETPRLSPEDEALL